MKKRIFCMILALALILGLAPGVLAAETGDGAKTITAQPSAAAADAPAALPEHEPLKNVTGAEPEDVVTHETSKVASVSFPGTYLSTDYYTSIEDAFNAACAAFSAGGITVQLLDSVEMHGDFSLTAQSAITLDLNGHTIRGAKLKLGQGTTRPYALHVKDSAAGSGAIDEIVLCSYYCDLYLDGAVSTTIKQLTFETTDNVRVKLTQGHVAKWYFGPNEQPYANFLASGSLFYAYEDGVLGELLDVSKYNQYGNQGKMAAARCPHESVQFDATANRYLCNVCKTSVSSGALLIKADGTSKYYADQTAALTAAQGSPGSTLKLLGDFGDCTISKGNFTLDLNGKKITANSAPVLEVTGAADVKLINTSESQSELSTTTRYNPSYTVKVGSADAKLQIGNEDGTDCAIWVHTPVSGQSLLLENGTLKLYGGKFSGVEITKPGATLFDLLPDNMAFTDGEGIKIIDPTGQPDPSQVRHWTTFYVKKHPQHNFTEGKCTACGRPCTHPSFNGDGYCTGCGKNFTAKLTTKNGTSRAFDTLSGAIAEAQKAENKGCTVTLLQTVELGSSNALEVAGSGCEFTFDLNGASLFGGTAFALTGTNQTLTIVNNGPSQYNPKIEAKTIVAMGSGSTVTFNGNNIRFYPQTALVDFADDATATMQVNINGGTYWIVGPQGNVLDIDQPHASVTITAGEIGNTDVTLYAVSVSNHGKLRVTGDPSNTKFTGIFDSLWVKDATADVKLSGGSYKSIRYDGKSAPGLHLELLADGYAFYERSGRLIDLAGNSGPNLGAPDGFSVMAHDHTFRGYLDGRCDCGYRCPHERIDSNGNCRDCNGRCPAKLENGSDVTYHTTVDFALQNAKDGATITLLDRTDLSLSTSRHVSTVHGKTVTIDLNGHTLDDNEGGQTLQIASDGAVIFRDNTKDGKAKGKVDVTVELDSGISAENNETAFLGGTFASITCTNDTVLPALAKANGFAFRHDGWLTIGQLGASSLENVTAYPLPFWITTMPTDGEMVYGTKILPEALRPEFGRADKFYYVAFKWNYTKDGEPEMLAMAGFPDWGEDPHNYKIQGEALPVGEYTLTVVPTVETNPGVYFTPYETMPTATLTVKQQEASVTKAPEPATGLIFDGQQHELLSNGGTAEGGTMVFAPAENGTYMEGIPSGSGAGTYKIWYKVKADENHSDSEPRSVTVTIAPRQLRAQVEDKTMYAGDALPKFTATYSGFVGNDTAESIVQADTAVFATTATGRQTGKFDITMTTAPQLNGGNYELKLSAVTKGTLTVNERPRMPKLPKDDETTPESPFDDVTQGDYFFDPVRWAVDEDIVGGVGGGRFAPHAACTRAQIVTMLWRAAGSPEPKGTASGFSDVPAGAYYAKAVAWAAEQGIAAGVGGGKFDPHAPCTRAQAVTLLHRAAGAPDTEADAPFADVPTTAYYQQPVAWATQQGITTGVGDGKFAPDATCTRAQIVTMLYRYFKK